MAQSKRWCFTLNNYVEKEIEQLKLVDCLYLVLGYEVGPTNGIKHIQGFLTFKKPYRLAALKKINDRAHWEAAKGTSLEASNYCKKDGDFYEIGTPPTPGKRTDLEEVAKLLKEGHAVATVADLFPVQYIRYGRGIRDLALITQKPYEHDDVRGIWYYGKPGSGKSYSARSNPPFYLKPQNKWFDGYAGETTIILDDLDEGGKCLGHHLKIWTDRYSCTGETKGGTVHLRHTQFIVTSNYRIGELFEGEMLKALIRRFKFKNFDLFPVYPTIPTTPPSTPPPSPNIKN